MLNQSIQKYQVDVLAVKLKQAALEKATERYIDRDDIDPVTDPLLIRVSDPRVKAMKVTRGSGYEFSADESEVFRREGATSNVRMPDIGFRLVLNKSLKKQ